MTPSLEPVKPRTLGLELVLAILVSLMVLVPGIQKYSLVDPWETHYGEVTREMLENHDLVHMTWNGADTPNGNEGFRSKPVLTMWLTAIGLSSMGVAKDGGYSGEMVASERTMIGIRLPIIIVATMGLTLMWLMLYRLVSRRVAWLALLVVGSTPFFCLISRQGIPDMPHCAFVMGALAMFTLAVEDGDRPITRAFAIRGRTITHGHIVMSAIGAWVIGQMLYYVFYFHASPALAVVRFPSPLIFFPLFMGLLFAGLWRSGWMIVRFVPVIVGALVGVVASLIKSRPIIHGVDHWDDYAPDRFIIRVLAFPVAWANGQGWAATNTIADHLLDMAALTTMRQVYMLWCYAFLGFSVLAKGPPGLTMVGAVGFFYVLLFNKWRDLYEGKFEIKRGLLTMTVVFLPWHIAMWLKDGLAFINEYLFTHILNRAGGDPDKSLGTFEYYTSQLGHGLWLWAALLPAAIAVAVLRARSDTREGRVRFMILLWAICGFGVFGIVQTKFHHYILPIVPALGILVAFFLDDLWAKREKFHPLYAGLAIGIVLLVCRDLMWQPERWIEMFVFRYDRPWPAGEPWTIDPSDGFLVLALVACIAICVLAVWRRGGVIAIGLAGFAICIWALQVYMPVAGTHWGMREAMRSYYVNRTIYGEKRVYFGPAEIVDDLDQHGDTFRFDSFIPDTLQLGQPMTETIQVNRAIGDDKQQVTQLVLVGTATAIGDHSVTLTLAKGEQQKLAKLIDDSKKRVTELKNAPAKPAATDALYGRPFVKYVDADHLIAFQLYWRGENFWSNDEIFSWAPELKTGFGKPENTELLKYLNDRTKAPIGRRFFVVTEAGRATTVKSILPTQRARETYEVIETTSNKFSMSSFIL